MKPSPPYLIGIAGGTASGKTTFAKRLKEAAPNRRAIILALDSYYHPLDHIPAAERALINYDHPSSIDSDLLHSHLRQLKQGKSIEAPIYDFARHTRASGKVLIEPSPIFIIEGILALHYQPLRNEFDLKIFVEVHDEVRFRRRVSRDTNERGRTEQSVKQQWDRSVLPMHVQYCEPSKHFADMLISDTNFDEMVLEVLRKTSADEKI